MMDLRPGAKVWEALATGGAIDLQPKVEIQAPTTNITKLLELRTGMKCMQYFELVICLFRKIAP